MATTRRELEGIVRRINLMTGNPTEPYSRVGDRNVANIGNYHLDGAYGGWALHQMMSEGVGIRAVISGYRPKAELATLMFAFINGLETAEAMEPDRPPLKRRGGKSNPGTNPEARKALTDEFAGEYKVQSKARQGLLVGDLLELQQEMEEDTASEYSEWDAARELRRRIGGARNLTAYTDSLEAGGGHGPADYGTWGAT